MELNHRLHRFLPLLAIVLSVAWFFLKTDVSVASSSTLPKLCQSALEEVRTNYFKGISPSAMKVSLLTGGYSNFSLLINVNNVQYVLRISKESDSLQGLKRELFAMQEAAKLDISPQIFYVTQNCAAVLMGYIPCDTLTLAQSRKPENICKIAKALIKAHGIAPNPYFEKTSSESALEVAQQIDDTSLIKNELEEGAILVHKYEEELAQINAPKANVHTDLNARNIFVDDHQAFFIDWEYSSWHDPFMDLSYLALRLDYSPKEEMLLLEYYLQHAPSEQEIERYYLTKKLNFAQLALYFFYFSSTFKKNGNGTIDTKAPLKDWSYYVKLFVEKQEPTVSPAQHCYELARVCLNKAKL